MKIEHLRTQAGLSQEALAKQAGMTAKTLDNWEQGNMPKAITSLKEICQAINCSADTLLGLPPLAHKNTSDSEPVFVPRMFYPDMLFVKETSKDEDLKDTIKNRPPFALPDHRRPFGTLSIQTVGGEYHYPVSERTQSSLQSALKVIEHWHDRRPRWVYTWTLNNRVVFINVRHLLNTQFVDDCVEQMPAYAKPQTYRALHEGLDHGHGQELSEACSGYIDEVGEQQALREAEQLTVAFASGETLSFINQDDYDIPHLRAMTEWNEPQPDRFLSLSTEDDYVTHSINLDNVAILELPRDHLLQKMGHEHWLGHYPNN